LEKTNLDCPDKRCPNKLFSERPSAVPANEFRVQRVQSSPTNYVVYLQLKKIGENRGGNGCDVKTIMSTKVDQTVKEITHHVPLRQMIHTKKQIGWSPEDH